MPSRKIVVAIILSLGSIISVWFVSKTPQSISNTVSKTPALSVSDYREIEENQNSDWQKILISVDPEKSSLAKTSSGEEETDFDPTTLTAQMARDFFSQYLLLKKGGRAITPEDVDTIVQNTLALPNYTKGTGPIYTLANIKISQKTDLDSVKKYMADLNLIVKNRKINEKRKPAKS